MVEIGQATFLEPKLTFSASAAFTIVGELLQRLATPHRIHPRITFPCGGQYHCLALIDGESGYLADFHLLTGRFHSHHGLSPAAEKWPEPRSFCLASVAQAYGIKKTATDILAALELTTLEIPDKRAGLAFSAIGMLLGRFIFDDSITIENGWGTEERHPDWLKDAPLDWIGEKINDFVAGQLWRVANERTGRSVIVDDCVDSACLVGTETFLDLSGDIQTAVDSLERFLRS